MLVKGIITVYFVNHIKSQIRCKVVVHSSTLSIEAQYQLYRLKSQGAWCIFWTMFMPLRQPL